jgi:hypothetical protein
VLVDPAVAVRDLFAVDEETRFRKRCDVGCGHWHSKILPNGSLSTASLVGLRA